MPGLGIGTRWLVVGSIGLGMVDASTVLATTQSMFLHRSSLSPPASAPRVKLVRNTPSCRADFEPLVTRLLADLPSYANRANIRYGKLNSYVMITGLPEFEPLPLTSSAGEPTEANREPPPDPKQVFFTTLVRRYEGNRPRQLQEYHWLFLTNTTSGWRFSMMYTMLGTYPQGKSTLTAQEH